MNGEFLYAICLGWPKEALRIRALRSDYKVRSGEIQSIQLLGTDDVLTWKHTADGLTIQMPDNKVNDYAAVFKITRK